MMKKYERLNRGKKLQLHTKQYNELSELLKDEGTFTTDASKKISLYNSSVNVSAILCCNSKLTDSGANSC